MWLAQVKPAFHYMYIQIKYTPAPYVCHVLPKHLLAIIMVHHSKFAFVYKRCPTDPQLEEAPPQQKLEAAPPRVEFNESYAAPTCRPPDRDRGPKVCPLKHMQCWPVFC